MRLLPNAVFKPVKYRKEAGLFTAKPLGWILHQQDGNGSPFEYFNNRYAPHRVFSTGWVAKDGRGEQYSELENISWAQNYGNPKYWSFEFEGFPNEPLTIAQINTAALWHKFLGTANKLANVPGELGIGIHSMGNNFGWLPTACPGSIRANQRRAILMAAGSSILVNPLPTPPASSNMPAWPLHSDHYFGMFEQTNPFCHSGTYSPGDREHIKDYQNQMRHRGWKCNNDGVFTQNTASVTRLFQVEKKLSVDSKVGPQTWTAAWTAKIT